MYNVIIRDAATGDIVTGGITVKTYISSTSDPGSLRNILPKDSSPTRLIYKRTIRSCSKIFDLECLNQSAVYFHFNFE
ncbi:hypothetical protein Tph_c14060 [Thermacetogenium phaeum DSM 12270]|uniref:Uncharacterized protein n=1 Tax=Thermacetogenium phaeum (strain ATCC BAA-254 / DSM 26808 / PB) TaxID=1089553 RepID=K4LF04_THEPS|nr:hypothetical protein Tph_c14060 [Thermacetogenium phaeum DSM 12270]